MDCLATQRIELFGVPIDAVHLGEAVQRLFQWIGERGGGCRFVVTPNCDHIVMLQNHDGLRGAYRGAALVLADGWPVVLASRFLRKPLPARVTGSDLVPAMFDAADSERPLRVFLLGAAEGVAERAARRIGSAWPAVTVVGTYSPPLGFEGDASETDAILSRIAASAPDLLVIGLGAPKQELWIHAHCAQIAAPVAICAGATIDFLAGQKKRAPVWMRRAGLEWFHRMASEPRRLTSRYLRDAWYFPRILWREWRAGKSVAA